ncbi:PREDICTED: GATA transcription factor 8-like [Ipomoea nil]|uniref:GATA transcription factor 8-like n=1 Tax=Ipomoea nil TaxID=35883 RepID=UPI000900C2E0|nr:PREDICTED: GATA transcription factor 8-like [Ipomoea nil]XP_019198449.1 PREDICTED: GATA transcription factor 8-like [Ipomoea nil]
MDSNFVDEIDCGSFFDHIDDLIDFPPENECGGVGSGDCANFPSIWDEPLPDSDPIFSAAHSHSASDLSAELSVPYEDIVQLEWLSAFVEESFSDGGLTLGKENYPLNPKPESDKKFQAASSPISVLESSSSSSSSSNSSCSGGKAMPLSPSQRGAQRARSKRPRPVAFNPRPVMQLIETPQVESFADSPAKKVPRPPAGAGEQKKKKKIKFSMPALPNPGAPNQDQGGAVRKCMHCEITKTPQWRAGPMGPKTLCNACGVRYKSGRLFPEYRPAASPTFVPSLHSNSHKKVVEMRTKAVPSLEQSPVSSVAPPEIK